MPSGALRRNQNPHKVGDLVTHTQRFNGTDEGRLWRVVKVEGTWVKAVPEWTVTGPSVLKPKRVQYYMFEAVDLVKLCTAYAQLGNLINDVVRARSGSQASTDASPEG